MNTYMDLSMHPPPHPPTHPTLIPITGIIASDGNPIYGHAKYGKNMAPWGVGNELKLRYDNIETMTILKRLCLRSYLLTLGQKMAFSMPIFSQLRHPACL